MTFEPIKHIEAQDPEFPRFRQRHVTLWLVWAGLTFGAVLIGGVAGLIVAPLAMGWVILQTQMNVYHRQQVENFHHYRQLEALTSLHALIKIRYPLPPMRLWVISPDFANLIVGTILQHKPRNILELGSGTSTIITAYSLEAAGIDGHIHSIEHQSDFTESSRRLLVSHGFADHVEVHHTKLKTLILNEQTYEWYTQDPLGPLQDIDLLIVDGPPVTGDTPARYPALPVLFEKLADDAIILVDDYMRSIDSEMVNRWLDEFNLEVLERFANEKGAIILQKRQHSAASSGDVNEIIAKVN